MRNNKTHNPKPAQPKSTPPKPRQVPLRESESPKRHIPPPPKK